MLPVVHRGLIAENRNANIRLRTNREKLRLVSNPFDLPDRMFIELFRLTKNAVRQLINQLGPHIKRPILERGVSVETKILCTLRFYGTGSYQRCVGEEYTFGLSQTSVHRAIHEVTRVIVERLENKINFPVTVEERTTIKNEFMVHWGFPGVVGVIDGTHIAILKPTDDEQNFINRKGYHSINCQVICDHTLKIRNILTNFGGSTHDSFIWRMSEVKAYMENLYNNREASWLLGDSGYPLQPYLMTPFRNPVPGSPESRYNEAHVAARNCVERCIGILKMRFRSLLKERTSRYTPQFVTQLIKAGAILHNICIEERIPLLQNFNHNNIEDEDLFQYQNEEVANEGILTRQRIVNRYFL